MIQPLQFRIQTEIFYNTHKNWLHRDMNKSFENFSF